MIKEAGVFSNSGQPMTSKIAICDLCHNRAEIFDTEKGNICGNCIEEPNGRQTPQKDKTPQPVETAFYSVPEPVSMSEEKKKYLEVIRDHVTEDLKKEVIKEIRRKKLLFYDFMHVVENDRWFSLVDLRRIALKADPDFEKVKKEPETVTKDEEEQPATWQFGEMPDLKVPSENPPPQEVLYNPEDTQPKRKNRRTRRAGRKRKNRRK